MNLWFYSSHSRNTVSILYFILQNSAYFTPWNPVSVLYHSMKPCACSLSLHETLWLFSLTPWHSVSLSLCSRPPALTGRHSVSVRCPPLCSSQLMLSCVWAFQTIKYLQLRPSKILNGHIWTVQVLLWWFVWNKTFLIISKNKHCFWSFILCSFFVCYVFWGKKEGAGSSKLCISSQGAKMSFKYEVP